MRASSLAVTIVPLTLTVAGAVTDLHRLPDYPDLHRALSTIIIAYISKKSRISQGVVYAHAKTHKRAQK